MSSTSTPRIVSFIADVSIAKGKAVKLNSTDGRHVTLGAANTDRCIGWAQEEATASGKLVEVALQGGGGQAILSETVVAGNDLCSHTDGRAAIVNAAGDQIVGRAMQDGVANDIISVEVYHATASAAQ